MGHFLGHLDFGTKKWDKIFLGQKSGTSRRTFFFDWDKKWDIFLILGQKNGTKFFWDKKVGHHGGPFFRLGQKNGTFLILGQKNGTKFFRDKKMGHHGGPLFRLGQKNGTFFDFGTKKWDIFLVLGQKSGTFFWFWDINFFVGQFCGTPLFPAVNTPPCWFMCLFSKSVQMRTKDIDCAFFKRRVSNIAFLGNKNQDLMRMNSCQKNHIFLDIHISTPRKREGLRESELKTSITSVFSTHF